MPWNLFAAFFSGAAAALGIGGGGILLLYLALTLQLEQLTAQGINLLFFLPCAVVSLCVYTKKRLISWRAALPIALGGLLGVLLGSRLASAVSPGILSHCFGGFLILLGLRELFSSKEANSLKPKD